MPARLSVVSDGTKASSKPTLDPFTMTEDSKGYDPDEIYTRGTDGHGNSENLQTRISPELAGEIAALVQSRIIPEYKTAQAFARDAIVHRMHYVLSRLDEIDEDQRRALRRISLEFQLSRADAERAQIADLNRSVDTMEALCDEAHRAGDVEAMRRALIQCEQMVVTIREPYASKVAEVQRKWSVEHRRMTTR